MPNDNSKPKKIEIFTTFRDKKYELLLNFVAMIIGVLVGFQLEGIRKQNSLNRNTRTKLHIMFLESEYNLTIGKNIYDICIDTTTQKLNFKKLDDLAARITFEDENVFNILQPYKISLIRSYIDAIHTLNITNEKYINYLESIGYKNNSKAESLKKLVEKNSLGFLATCYVLQQEFKSFFNKKEYEKRKIKEVELEIQKAKELILQGKFKTEK